MESTRFIPKLYGGKWYVWDTENKAFSHRCCFKSYFSAKACGHAISYYENSDMKAYNEYIKDIAMGMVNLDAGYPY